ncbi:unnamed protein product [Penicillium bialowiezense]
MASLPMQGLDTNVDYLMKCIGLTPLVPDFRIMGRINGTSAKAERDKFRALQSQLRAAIEQNSLTKFTSGGAKVPVNEHYIHLFMAIDLANGQPNFKNVARGLGIKQPAARMKYNRLKTAILAAIADDTDSEWVL